MTKNVYLTIAALAAFAVPAHAQKGGASGPCGKDIACAELTIQGTTGPPNVVGDSGTLSIYRDYRATGGDPCVKAEYRIRYKSVVVNVNRDGDAACAGASARGIIVSFPASICSYLTSSAAGYFDGDGVYTELEGGACSLVLRHPPANPRITVSGFVPDPLQPQAGDVYIPFMNPHFGEAGVTYSSFALSLVDAPDAAPGTVGTRVSYSGEALLETYAGKLNPKLNKTFPFSLEFEVQVLN